MDRLEAMSLLIDVVDSGSFSAAAEQGQLPIKMRFFMDFAVPRLRHVLLHQGRFQE